MKHIEETQNNTFSDEQLMNENETVSNNEINNENGNEIGNDNNKINQYLNKTLANNAADSDNVDKTFEIRNSVTISGCVEGEMTLSHEIEKEKFFEFFVKVQRLSGIFDMLPVTISERVLMNMEVKSGDFVRIVGEYRSYNKIVNEKSRLILTVFAKEFEKLNSQQNENKINLSGFICQKPNYRKTPFEREITDVLLAVNRCKYHKSDYIPLILWGRNARFAGLLNVGDKLEIEGRIQSREYEKKLQDGSVEKRIAYEVSCQSMTKSNSVVQMQVSSHDDNSLNDVGNAINH